MRSTIVFGELLFNDLIKVTLNVMVVERLCFVN